METKDNDKQDTMEITLKVAAVSGKTHGIKDFSDKWWNMKEGLPEQYKNNLIKQVNDVRTGDIVKLICDRGKNYIAVEIMETGNDRDDIISFQQLLEKAHKEFDNINIDTGIVVNGSTGEPIFGMECPLFRAVVRAIKDGKETVVTAHGEASKDNVTGQNIQDALPRMAETRAISRCLRWLLSEETAKEEFPDGGS